MKVIRWIQLTGIGRGKGGLFVFLLESFMVFLFFYLSRFTLVMRFILEVFKQP